jgi:hypothetical protein
LIAIVAKSFAGVFGLKTKVDEMKIATGNIINKYGDKKGNDFFMTLKFCLTIKYSIFLTVTRIFYTK